MAEGSSAVALKLPDEIAEAATEFPVDLRDAESVESFARAQGCAVGAAEKCLMEKFKAAPVSVLSTKAIKLGASFVLTQSLSEVGKTARPTQVSRKFDAARLGEQVRDSTREVVRTGLRLAPGPGGGCGGGGGAKAQPAQPAPPDKGAAATGKAAP